MRFVVVAMLLVAGIAHAQSGHVDDGTAAHVDDAELTRAKLLEAKLEYEEALVLAERVISQGHADRDKLIELHFFAGKLAAGLDRVDVAQEHFARVLTLVPNTTLPDGTSPKIAMPFDAARGQTAPLRIVVKAGKAEPEVVIEADPIHIVAKTEIVPRRDVAGGTYFEIRARDVFGNVVWSSTAPGPASSPTTSPEERSPLYKRQLVWAGGVVVFGAFAGFSAWRFSVAQSDWNALKAGNHDYSELLDVEHRGRHWAIATYAGLGAAAACGVLTVLTRDSGGRRPPEVAISAHSITFGFSSRF